MYILRFRYLTVKIIYRKHYTAKNELIKYLKLYSRCDGEVEKLQTEEWQQMRWFIFNGAIN